MQTVGRKNNPRVLKILSASDSPVRLTGGNMSAVHALSMDVPAKPIIIPGDAGIVAKTT